MAAFEAWLVFLILVVNVVGELQRKRTLAASRGFLAAARLSCKSFSLIFYEFLFLQSFSLVNKTGAQGDITTYN